MMKNDSAPFILLKNIAGKALVRRCELIGMKGVSDPDRAIPRAGSNPGLEDPDTIIGLTLAKPTLPDLTRTVLAYGLRRTERVLDRLAEDGDIPPPIVETDRRMLRNIRTGLVHAAR